MLKIPNTAAYLKQHNHTKKESAEILLAQLEEFHLQKITPYNAPYSSQVNLPLSWWDMCVSTPPYLQLLATKIFTIIPHAASCEEFGQFVNGWLEKEEQDYQLII